MRPLVVAVTTLAVVLAGCTDETDGSAEDVDPEGVVAIILGLVSEDRFTEATDLTDLHQAELLLLLEGVPADDILSRIEDEGTVVGSNFWEGFAESSSPGLSDDSGVSAQGEVEIGAERGYLVAVTLSNGQERRWVVRSTSSGPVVDLFASFASGFAGSLIAPVERLLGNDSEDARRLLGLLVGELASLEVAATDPNITPTESQEIITLIERISRAQG